MRYIFSRILLQNSLIWNPCFIFDNGQCSVGGKHLLLNFFKGDRVQATEQCCLMKGKAALQICLSHYFGFAPFFFPLWTSSSESWWAEYSRHWAKGSNLCFLLHRPAWITSLGTWLSSCWQKSTNAQEENSTHWNFPRVFTYLLLQVKAKWLVCCVHTTLK